MKGNLSWTMVCIIAICSCDRDKPRPSSTHPSTTAESDQLDLRPKAALPSIAPYILWIIR